MGFKSFQTYGSKVAITKIPVQPALEIGITARYFKLEVDAVRTSGGGVQISNLHLYFNGKQVSNSGVVASNIDVFSARGAFTATDMFDENLSTYLYSATEKNIITFTYPADITMNHYDWATAVNNIGRDPVSWRLLYSTDNSNFTLIDQQVNFPTTEIRSKYIPTIPIVRLINAQYFRYEIDAVRSSGQGVQIAEILLYFNGKNISNSGVTSSNLDKFGRGFDSQSVFDDNIGTYLYSGTEKNVITFTYPNKITMNQYNLATAVNNIGRDPVSWRLLYSTDNTTFTLLDQQTNFLPSLVRNEFIPIIQIRIPSIIKINNFNFMNPLKTDPFTYIPTLPSWTVDKADGIVISRAGSPFHPTSNTNLPSGYTGDYEQTLSYQSGNSINTNISQELFITPAKYTLSFWSSGRGDGNYLASNVFSIYLGETLLVENVSPSPANWTNYTYTYNALSSGNVILRIFIQNPSGADSTINFANFAII